MAANPSKRGRAISLAALAATSALAAWTFTHLSVTTEITQFLPSSEDRELAHIAEEMASSDLNRTITLTIEAPDTDTAVAASGELADRLARRRDVSWVRRGPSEDLDQAFYDLYFPRRLLFFADSRSEAEAQLTDESLRAAAHDLKQRLSSPTGTFVRQIAQRDPLLAFAHHLERMRDAQQGGLSVARGQLVSEDGRHGVLFLASRASPFDGAASRRLLTGIDDDFAAVNAAHGGALRLEESAVHRFAAASEEVIRADITRISVISTIGTIILFLLLFRSPRYLVLGSIPLVVGAVAGLAVTQLVFGRVHGIGLAFGSSLIGVAVDYVSHYMNHHTLAPAPGGPMASLKRIWPGLALGAATTIAGLAGLAWTSFPGIRELAVNATVGIFAALLATRWIVPPWMPAVPKPTRLHVWCARSLETGLARMRRSRFARFGFPAVALLVAAVGVAKLEWVDDVRVLNVLDPVLVAEDERVRDRVSRMDAGRFVIAYGSDEETALQRNDEVYRRLTAGMEAGEVARFRSLHSFLPSARTQRSSLEALRRSPALYDRLSRALEQEGFVASAFEPFRGALREHPEPLTWEAIQSSPVGPLAQSFRVDLDGGRVGFITMMRGGDLDALTARLSGLRGVRLFDQSRFLGSAYGRFRTRTLEMVGVGLIAVFFLLLVRYRRIVPAIAAFAPAVLAAATSVGALVLLGYQTNLMHLVALLLVLGMGVDYGVFMVEAHGDEEAVGPTLAGMLLDCLTTILSFGLLAMSVNPALRALGAITTLGVTLSCVLAPVAWLFLPKEKRR